MAARTVNCRNWDAGYDHRPPPPFALHVTGECYVPQGTSVALKRREDPDPQTTTLELEAVISGPEVPADAPSVSQEVRYKEETDIEYETVAIRVTVPVQHAF